MDGIVVHQNAVGGAFQVVKLPAFARPPKKVANDKGEQNADGDEYIQAFHVYRLPSKSLS